MDIDGRWKAIKSKNLCRSCLIPHRKWPCRSGKKCGVQNCRIRHHELLHSPPTSCAVATSSVGITSGNVSHQNHHSSFSRSLFRYLPITIYGNGRKINTFAFLDDGSSATLVENNIAVELGITGPTDTLFLSWTNYITREEKDSRRITVTVSGQECKEQYKLSNVCTVGELKLPTQTLQYEDLRERYPHLKGLPIQSYTNVVPGMIIGVEHARLLTTLKAREGNGNDPVAAKTRLGWCIYGRPTSELASAERLNFHHDLSNRELYEQMRQFFMAEEAKDSKKLESEDERKAREILEVTTKKIDGRFETGLLWKNGEAVMPNSYPMALNRLKSLEKRLGKNPELYRRVKEQITLYEQKGYAHLITREELEATKPEHTWYVPLGVVQNPKKPEKVRLIWDAAARVGGISLNDMLLKGPDMLTSLPDILMGFRMRNIAVCGDIREMFHQLHIQEQDKQYLRFLWREHPTETISIYVMDVAIFGATCSPCSAQFVKNKNAHELKKAFPKASQAIIKAHYVEDFLDSVNTVDEAVELVRVVKYVHLQAGFEIRNFSSNSLEVLDRLGESKESQCKAMNLEKPDGVERVLGLVWQPSQDIFTFDIGNRVEIRKLVEAELVPTKRQVLRTIMSLFDPLGFVTHFVIHGKILMQNVWRTGTDWDEDNTEDLVCEWRRWSQMLLQLGHVRVPRCFFSGAKEEALQTLQIHVFVEGSENVSACVAYLRIMDEGVPRCALVAAKSKVAPLKPLSMELQAALIGSRLLDSICSSIALPIHQRFLWSDSLTVLSWLWSDSRRYHQFVSFHVGEILTTTNVDEWRYVPSKMNVADEATKWKNGPSFDPASRWFSGPSFLYLTVQQWPTKHQKSSTEEELRTAFLHMHHSATNQPFIQVDRFSKWERLMGTTAYLLRSTKLFKKQRLVGPLASEEFIDAENVLWKMVQSEVYGEELSVLEYNHNNETEKPRKLKKLSPLYKLSPLLDEYGVMRMNSRAVDAHPVSFQVTHSIILPKKHRLTLLLVDSYRRRFLHANNETVCNEMKQKFWISSLRRVIKRVSQECQHCRIYKAIPQQPMMAPLPLVRLTPFFKPFTYTGIDYFEPILVKQGRSLVKQWVVLFTCLTVRAVHLEIAYSLSTQSCILAIRRFVARRGSPQAFYSDNGTNFLGVNNILKEQMRRINEACSVAFTNAQTTWHFNPPAAPHMGGSWERLVRSVKTAMKTIADHPQHPSDEVLETVALEAEATVNCRPLTYIPLETVEHEALTPNHFLLYGSQGIKLPPGQVVLTGGMLRDSWKLAQYLVDQFWIRWIHEYIPTITRRTKWFNPVKPLEPGDLVVVIESNQRNGWFRGRIVEVVQGVDGQVRRALVRVKNELMWRPAGKLALLEVQEKPGQDVKKDEPESPELHGRENVHNTAELGTRL